ncbi:RidA family protein [Peptoniphilus sp. MSJ-1]|uniref:RidA family protein n=1 Tax=Peptoniphilus ovalis TaxID=2841503 RepID=A0ABS6FIC0_9FIRM|nr:RidA family protein [Peptoniphilus ovalis]MBU5669927.1 RidA family protein [Peptoniphilus ovalis]
MSKNPIPQGKYVPAKKINNLVYSAGMTPRVDGKLILTGKIKSNEDIEKYKDSVIQAAKNSLIAIKNSLSESEKLDDIVNLTVYVNCEEDFSLHSKIADFASEYLVDELGERGISPRTSVGVASLPGDAPVEVQIIASFI